MKVQQEPKFDHKSPAAKIQEKKKINFVATFPLLCDLNLCAAFKLNKTSMVPSPEHGN